jgi:hypothetical protein
MKKEQLKKELKKIPMYRMIGKLQLICLLALFISPFIGIWHDWELSYKICISGIIGTIIMYWVSVLFDKAFEKMLEDYDENEDNSEFQKRLNSLMRKRNKKNENNF